MSETMYEEKTHFVLDEVENKIAKVKVIGVGGAGGNALNRMKEMDITNAEFIAVNTDNQALENSLADVKISIGKETTNNLGAGARPEIGRQAVQEDIKKIEECMQGADIIFIAAGMGGGTGTGAAPVIAETARKLGILTVAVVSLPFRFEGPIRKRNALKGHEELRQAVDSIITIENQNIFKVIDKNTSTKQAYFVADEVLANAVRSVCSIITDHGTINVDFNDVRTIMKEGGNAVMGTGIGEGENRTLDAAHVAVECPLLGENGIKGATALLINICHGENFLMSELEAAMDYIIAEVGDGLEPEVIYGECIKPNMENKVSITVIATKFIKELETQKVTSEESKASIPEAHQVTKREESKPRETTNFHLSFERETRHFDVAAALTAPISNQLPSSEEMVKQEVLPPTSFVSANTGVNVSPTGFHNLNMNVLQVEGNEEVIAPKQREQNPNDMTVYSSNASVSFSGTNNNFVKPQEEKKDPSSAQQADWTSGIDFDSLPNLRNEFFDRDNF
jgi:cell division protein FtsZ